LLDFNPILVGHVEPDPNPTTVANVWRSKEPVGRGGSHRILGAERRSAPEAKLTPVVAVREHDERLLVANEPGWFSVAHPLGDFGKRQANSAQLLEPLGFIHEMSLSVSPKGFYSLYRRARMVRPKMKRGLLFTLSFWLVGAAVIRGTLLMPHYCPPVSPESAIFAARESAGWIERAQNADGTYVYEYDRKANREPGGYNVVRHAGVTMSLYQLAAAGDLSVLAAADHGMQYMIDHLYRHDDWAAFQNPDDGAVQLGASALMLDALMQRRVATNEPRFDELSREVARGLLALQLDDGAFLNRWDPSTAAPVPDDRSKYATGEAFWGLTLMHRFFPGEGWDTFAYKTADYLALSRDEYEHQKFPPWADQWASYGFGEMADWPLQDYHIAYARSLAERFGFLVRVESQRRDNWFSKALHGRQARAAGMGTWVEGLTSLYRLAAIDPRMADMKDKIAERIDCGAGMLADRQVSENIAGRTANPERTRGAWFTNDITRMDDQQHALSALLRSAPILATRENR